jgi:hypothetical protein
MHLHRLCTSQRNTQWFTDLRYDYNVASFVAELRQRICDLRLTIDREVTRMRSAAQRRFDANLAAAVHRTLQSDALPSRLLSVVNQHAYGLLTSSAAELQSVMVQHFTSVFALPPADDTPLPYDPPCNRQIGEILSSKQIVLSDR